ncbi:MAG: hypothetical protein AB7N70_16240 [Dehalococcoidia bacterium]
MSELVQGALYPAVRPKDIRAFEVSLPPLAEQRRIVAAIEAVLARVNAARERLSRTRDNLKRYRAAVLNAAVEGRLTEDWRAEHAGEVEPAEVLLRHILDERRRLWEEAEKARYAAAGKRAPFDWRSRYKEPAAPDTSELPELPDGWLWTSTDQLVSYLRNGLAQKPQLDPPGHRILRISAVRPMSVDLSDVRYLREPPDKVRGFWIEDGDLLLTRYNGSVDLLGVAGKVRDCSEPTLHPDKLIRVRTVVPEPLADYLELTLNVGESRRHLERRARSSAGQTGISGQDVRETPVPLPPLTEQQVVIQRVGRLLSLASAIDTRIATALAQTERMKDALLAKAFRGELVPQDPADEPAAVMLERLRSAHGEDRTPRTGHPRGRPRQAR